ncbi:MAG: CHAT domain-containing protein [Deltaproteobacteria bacterium]|nr:MAG: CHAT domain-containing protein [Deltaproteobacteria bacterium]
MISLLTGAARGAPPALAEARALQQRGALREAQKAYEALLPELRSSDPAALGAALNALSQIASSQGQYDSAAARAREAADVHRALGDKGGEAHAIQLLGVAEIYQAHYASALHQLDTALALARTIGDREREVAVLNNVGSIHFHQARYLDALRAYREALDSAGQAGAAPWSMRLRRITLTNLAALFQRVGHEDQAIQLYGELRNAPEALTPNEQARLLSNLGDLYQSLGDPIKALETYRVAQRLLAGNEHKQARIRVLTNIGIVQALDLGDLPVAVAAFTDALALAEQSGDRREAILAHLYRGESLYRQGDAGGATRNFEAALATARQLGTTEEQWKALYGLGRLARSAHRDEMASTHFRDALSAIESVRAQLQLASLKTDFLADKRDVYDALLEILLERPDAAAFFEVLERARARMFQDRLAVAQPTLAAVQARLEAGTVLLEYWVGPRSAAVLWATREAAGIASLPAVGPTLGEISSLLNEASAGTTDGWKRPAATIGARLLGGIPALGRPDATHLIVVPDGALGEIPFELLDAGTGSPIIERFDVSYLPSAAVLLRDSSDRSRFWAPPWKRQLVSFAAPRIQPASHSAAMELGGAELSNPLPASAEEARAIARTCPGRAQLFLGNENLKRHLVEGAATGVPLLHLATHAVADMASAERSRILFSPDREQDGADYLFLKEVYDLDLRGVDLATLSACETERGKLVRGEGAYAFSRALLSAGARAAVTTLWRVADEPARDFMAQLYFDLNRGKPKAEALRLAKLRFLRSGTALRHPRYWAAFILTGDGLSPIPRVLSWSTLLGVVGMVLLGGSVAAILVRNAAASRSAGRSSPGGGTRP